MSTSRRERGRGLAAIRSLGLVLFLYALSMIFGESKPDGEPEMARSRQDPVILPLTAPANALPGAMMAVVILSIRLALRSAKRVGEFTAPAP